MYLMGAIPNKIFYRPFIPHKYKFIDSFIPKVKTLLALSF